MEAQVIIKRGRGRPKGIPKTGGRKPGAENKITRDVKEMVLTALSEAGGVDYLKKISLENPTAFVSLIGRIIPTESKVDMNVKGLAKILSELGRN